MSILINKNRIMGLLDQIYEVSRSLSGVSGVSRSGGIISGELEVNGNMAVTGDLQFYNSNFYIDSENNRLGINITTPSGLLHIYNSSGDAGFEFEGSGGNGFKFIYGNALQEDGGNYDMQADVTHSDSGSFEFNSYFNDESRVYEAVDFSETKNGYYLFDSVQNSRPSYYNVNFGILLYFNGTTWEMKPTLGTAFFGNDSTGTYPPVDGWYSYGDFGPTGTIVEYTASKIQVTDYEKSFLDIKINSTEFNSDIGINGVILEDVSGEVPAGSELLLSSSSSTSFCGLLMTSIIKNFTKAKAQSLCVGWNDSGIIKKATVSEVKTILSQLDDVYFRVSFNLPNIDIYIVNDSAHRVVLRGLVKKLPKER